MLDINIKNWVTPALLLLAVFLTIANFYSVWIAGVLPFDLIWFSVATLARFYLAFNLDIYKKLTQTITWIYFDFSFLAFYGIMSLDEAVVVCPDAATRISFIIGTLILVAHACIVAATSRGTQKARAFSNWHWGPSIVPKAKLLMLATFAVALITQFLSWRLGIAELGGYRDNFVRLPLGLNGVIVSYRMAAVPFLVIILLDIFHDKKLKLYQVATILLFIMFLIIETKIRLSKGSFLLGFLPVFSWMCWRQIFRLKHVFLIFAFMLPFILIYPYLNMLRSIKHTNVTEVADISAYFNQFDSPVDQALAGATKLNARIFGDAQRLSVSYDKFSGSWLHNNFHAVLDYGNVSKYYTYEILGFKGGGRGFSAGTTMVVESYLLFGATGIVVLVLLFLFAQVYIDRGTIPLLCANAPSCAFASYLFYVYLAGGFMQSLFKFEYFVPLFALLAFNWYLFKWSRADGSYPSPANR